MKRATLFLTVVIIFACGTPRPEGLTEVKTPFSANRYQTSSTWFRSTGSGESINMETARDKAMLSARQRLASEIETTVKKVSEEYKGERQSADVTGDFGSRFQSMTREVLSQKLVEVQTIDEKIYQAKDRIYIVHVALESRKKTVYKKLKESAERSSTLSLAEKDQVLKMIDKSIRDLNDGD